MPRSKRPRRPRRPEPEPFERPPAVWRALGAPLELYDVEAAAAAELAANGAILDEGEPGYPGPSWFYARRWWRAHRWRFLLDVGQLTPRELRIVQGSRRHYPP